MLIVALLTVMLLPLSSFAETADQWQARFQSHLANAIPFDSPLDQATAMNQAKRDRDSENSPQPQPSYSVPPPPVSYSIYRDTLGSMIFGSDGSSCQSFTDSLGATVHCY